MSQGEKARALLRSFESAHLTSLLKSLLFTGMVPKQKVLLEACPKP